VDPEETCCNGHDCVHTYPVDVIQRLRKYLNMQSFPVRRAFMADRTLYTGFEKEQVKKGDRLQVFHMENADVLSTRLDIALANTRQLPPPGVNDPNLRPVCQRGFFHISGLSSGVLYSYNKRGDGSPPTAVDRAINPDRAREPRVENAPKKEEVVGWLRELSKLATVLPNDEQGFKILPYRTPRAVHAIYVREMELQKGCAWADEEAAVYDISGGNKWDASVLPADDAPVPVRQPVIPLEEQAIRCRYGNALCGKKGTLPTHLGIASFTYFKTVWHADRVAGLARCRAFMPFAKCDVCVTFREKDLETKDMTIKQQLRKEQADHLEEVKRERSAYYQHRLQGVQSPDSYLSMIIDGANQARHALPSTVEKSHVSDKAWKMQLHLMGVIVHGRGTWAYTCPPHVAQGNNTTIQALWDTIVDIFQKDGRLPPVLYLQLDNTTKQCKGKYVMGFLGLLVKLGIFDKIIVGFLPVGHTHEDIDQFFSRIAIFMRNHPAMDREEFGRCIRNSYTKYGQAPTVVHWDSVANISDWIGPSLGDVTGLTDYRHFKIVRSAREDGSTEVWWMCRSSPGSTDPQDQWRGAQPLTTHVSLFPKGAPDLLATAIAGRMPPCKRSTFNLDATAFALMLVKVHAGLEDLRKVLPRFTARNYDSCKALAEMVATPVDVPIPFNWHVEDIRALTEYRSREIALQAIQGAVENNPEPAWPHKVGQYVLLRPCEGELKPFYVAMIKDKVTTEDGRAAVRLCYYAHEEDNAEDTDVFTGSYEPHLNHFKKPKNELPLLAVHGSEIQTIIPMVKARARMGGGYRIQIADRGLKIAKYWVSRFESSGASDVEEDD
jgi:hypothetical protein